jgi:hypothetical protein
VPAFRAAVFYADVVSRDETCRCRREVKEERRRRREGIER